MPRVLERGDIFFAYRPRIGEGRAESLDQVQRFFMILRPRDEDAYRRLVVGRKHLPELVARQRVWAFVDRVGNRPQAVTEDLTAARYRTKTRGERERPAARPAGEGVYAIVDHDGHAHLAYQLGVLHEPPEVLRELRIEPRASYVVAVLNPDAPGKEGAGTDEPPVYPEALRERFRGRRFAALEPDFLDQEGTELILIGTDEDPERELGVQLESERETASTAEIFRDLQVDGERYPGKPLSSGAWD